jgi:hypothetical protein
MARLNSLILLLSLTLSVEAQDIFPGPIMRVIAAAGGGPPTYLREQGFEGAGYDNGETWTESGATINEDYTGVVLDGSQTLRIAWASTAPNTKTSFTSVDEVWVYFLLRPITIENANRIIASITGSGTRVLELKVVASTAALRVQWGSTATTVGTLSAATTYHVWVHYKKGTGANSIIDVGFSTDGTRPTSGNNFAQSTSNSSTIQVNELILGEGTSYIQEYLYDKVRVDDVQIGDNPD